MPKIYCITGSEVLERKLRKRKLKLLFRRLENIWEKITENLISY